MELTRLKDDWTWMELQTQMVRPTEMEPPMLMVLLTPTEQLMWTVLLKLMELQRQMVWPTRTELKMTKALLRLMEPLRRTVPLIETELLTEMVC
mmetsp:Transcript_29982/g.63612  ORF Transcript_29982/g.63612 Transcript_29982/m.63612 type:complete len:94 (-) Transcript_29982:784-1065(-)